MESCSAECLIIKPILIMRLDRVNVTMPTRDISAHLATDKWSLAIVLYSAVYLTLGSTGTNPDILNVHKYLI